MNLLEFKKLRTWEFQNFGIKNFGACTKNEFSKLGMCKDFLIKNIGTFRYWILLKILNFKMLQFQNWGLVKCKKNSGLVKNVQIGDLIFQFQIGDL